MPALSDALLLRALGLSVLPVHAPGMPLPPSAPEEDAGKRPLVRWAPYQDRLPDLREIRAWQRKYPDANLGIVTGAVSGLVVVDVDPTGLATLEQWEPSLPETWRARTGRGGVHLYFRHPGDEIRSATGLLPGVDVRGDGGFVVVPPSLHRSGERYEWTTPPTAADLADPPAWLLALLTQARDNARPPGFRLPEHIPPGARNATLYRFARSLRLRGMSEAEVFAALEVANARAEPPLPEDELAEITSKAFAQGDYAHPQGKEGSPSPKGLARAQVVRLSEVEPQEVEWLWAGRVPRGKLTLIVGDPDTGKSFLSLDLIARLTVGRPWPDGEPAPLGNAILLTAEDGLADTVRPRLDRLGGDPARVWVLEAIVQGTTQRPFNLGADLEALEREIAKTGACVVVIDPLSAYLGKADSWKDAEVRGLLGPLAALAERTGVAVAGILHLTKDDQRRAIHRALGSVAFTAAARAVFVVAKDREDEDRRLFVPVKLNLARHPPALAFRITEAGLEWEGSPVEGVDADNVLARPGSPDDRAERRDAEEFLREVLKDGEAPSTEVFAAARANGIASRTLKRAKARLGARSRHEGQPGEGGRWFWWLPEPSKGANPAPKSAIAQEVAPFEQVIETKAEDSRTSPKSATSRTVAPFGSESGPLREEEAGSQGAAPDVWTCTVCRQRVPRAAFPAHVEAHEREDAAQGRGR